MDEKIPLPKSAALHALAYNDASGGKRLKPSTIRKIDDVVFDDSQHHPHAYSRLLAAAIHANVGFAVECLKKNDIVRATTAATDAAHLLHDFGIFRIAPSRLLEIAKEEVAAINGPPSRSGNRTIKVNGKTYKNAQDWRRAERPDLDPDYVTRALNKALRQSPRAEFAGCLFERVL